MFKAWPAIDSRTAIWDRCRTQIYSYNFCVCVSLLLKMTHAVTAEIDKRSSR